MLLEVASVATCQPFWTVEAAEEAHYLGTGNVAEIGVGDGASMTH